MSFESIDIPELEADNVVNVYDTIAKKFSHTRYKAWDTTIDFINSLDHDTKTLEVGCGNGKNMNLREDILFFGCDISEGLQTICLNKGLQVIKCDGCDLKYEDDFFDSVYSIAVLHHMSNDDRRLKFISEMVRVTKDKGKIFFQVWATSEPKYLLSKTVFDKESDDYNELDRLVIFKDNGKEYERYYHFFTKEEMERIIDLFNEKHSEKITGEISFTKNNWIFTGIIQK